MRILLPDNFAVEAMLARTSEELAKGLSGYKALPESGGMLFLFQDGRPSHAFNMRGMLFPIDFVGFERRGKVLQVLSSVRPDEVTSYIIQGPNVLEIKAGTAARHGVRPGVYLR